MQENTNKTLALNSIILYAKMIVTTACALFATRFALAALGVDDFGLFSVLGSIISFIGLFNTIMLSSTNRFLSVAIGIGDVIEINKVFNVNNTIFIVTSLFVMIIAYPLGAWYIHHFINYNGDTNNAIMVFCITMGGSLLSSIGIPYNGLLMAKEQFIVFSSVEIFSSMLKLLVSWAILNFFEDKLLIYTLTIAFTTGLPTIIYWIYCHRTYNELVHWKFVRDNSAYVEILKFSGWVAYGAVAYVAKAQGAALLVNAFFNTIMNTALGLANTVISFVTMFANNVTQPMQPQIIKSYAANNLERTDELLIMSTRFSFLLMLFVSGPFFIAGDWIINLWLGDIPPYVSSFTILLIIDNLIMSFNSGISVLIFASGKIAVYQIIINTLRIISIIIAYLVLKSGAPPEYLLYTYILFTLFIVFITQYILIKILHYKSINLIKRSYIPSILVFLLFIPVIMIDYPMYPVLKISLSMLYLLFLDFFVGLNKNERSKLKTILKNRINYER